MKLSSHFDSSEFACLDGCGLMNVNPLLIQRLETLRGLLGKPIKVMSGCRCKAHNKAVKGKKFSQHLKGRAADISVSGVTAARLKPLAEKVFGYFSGIGTYPQYPNMLHVDVRTWHARW